VLPMLATSALLCFTAGPHLLAQSTAQSDADAASKIDPDVMDALNKMGTYLRALPALEVKADITTDNVTDDGQAIEASSTVDLIAVRPNRMRVEITSDDQHKFYFFDGKNFTLYGAIVNYFTTVPAPATIRELITNASDKYGIDFPLTDVFFWGTDQSKVSAITSAMDIGPSNVDGFTCEHYAFRQPGIDWQIWIQLGDFPLPRRLVIRTLTDDAKPQYTERMSWNLAPSYSDNAFTFDPPSGALEIPIDEVKPASTDASK
jgi:hypothetical protein